MIKSIKALPRDDLIHLGSLLLILTAVLFAFINADVAVYTSLVKLFLFHILTWPLLVWAVMRDRLRLTRAGLVLLVFNCLNLALACFAPYKMYAVSRLADLALYTAWFFLVSAAADKQSHRRILLGGFYLIITCFSALGIIYHGLLPFITDISRSYRMVFPASNPNCFAAVLLPAICLGIYYAWHNLKKGKQFFTALALLIIHLTAFALIKSKAAFAGIVLAGLIWMAVYVYTRYSRRWLLGLYAIIIIIGGILAGHFANRLEGTFMVRRMAWPAGIEMTLYRGIGYGPGNAAAHIQQYLDPAWSITDGFGAYIWHVHNEYLEIGTETGIAGIVIWVLFLGLLIRAYRVDLTAGFGPGIAAGIGLTALAIDMGAGVAMRLWTLPVVFWYIAALAPGESILHPEQIKTWRKPLAILAILLCTVGWYAASRSWQAESAFAAGLDPDQPIGIRNNQLKKARINPLVPRDALKAAWYRAYTLTKEVDKGAPRELLDDAWESICFLHAHHPDFNGSRALAGRILYRQAKYDEAFREALQAFRNNPFNPIARRLLGISGLRLAGILENDSLETVHNKIAHQLAAVQNQDEQFICAGLIAMQAGHYQLVPQYLVQVSDADPHLHAIAGIIPIPFLAQNDRNLPSVLKAIERYLASYPGDEYARAVKIKILKQTAIALEHEGQLNQALYALETIIEMQPDNLEIRGERVRLLNLEGRHQEAKAEQKEIDLRQ